MIVQFFIALFGVTAIALAQSTVLERRKWAPVLGLVGQPFWFYMAIESAQWGVFALCILYTLSWGKGLHTFWFKSKAGTVKVVEPEPETESETQRLGTQWYEENLVCPHTNEQGVHPRQVWFPRAHVIAALEKAQDALGVGVKK